MERTVPKEAKAAGVGSDVSADLTAMGDGDVRRGEGGIRTCLSHQGRWA